LYAFARTQREKQQQIAAVSQPEKGAGPFLGKKTATNSALDKSQSFIQSKAQLNRDVSV